VSSQSKEERVILLVSTSSRAQECATTIEQKCHQSTQIAASPALAVAALHEHDIDALVIDESLQHADIGADGLIEAHTGMAVPIYVNLSIHAAERVAYEVNCGLQRLARERAAASRAAISDLHNAFRGDVTAILLNAELVMQERSLPAGTVEKVRVIRELAERMRSKFDSVPVAFRPGALRPHLVERSQASPSDN
jgi:hypothetical protein